MFINHYPNILAAHLATTQPKYKFNVDFMYRNEIIICSRMDLSSRSELWSCRLLNDNYYGQFTRFAMQG